MHMATKEFFPIVRRDAEYVAGAMAALVLLVFFSFAIATTAMELMRLLASLVAATPG